MSERATEIVWDPLLRSTTERNKQAPVLINYRVGKKRYEKYPDSEDLEVIRRIDELSPGAGAPTSKMMFLDPPWGEMYRAGYHAGMTHSHHFYWRRSLIVLSDIFESVRDDFELLYWFTSTLPWCSRENRLHIGNYFGKKGGVITSYRGAIYIASLGVETNPLVRLRLRTSSALVEVSKAKLTTIVTTQSSTRLDIPNDIIDYVFIDPPFGDNLMYSELNFLWESWLRVWTNNDQEIIISGFQGKELASYTKMMRTALSELYRVLRPCHWITVQFHNSKNTVWNAIQTALFEAGFIVADVRTMDKGKASFKQVVAAGAVKKDLVISAYKPPDELETRFRLEGGTEEMAWSFVRSHLEQLPIWVEPGDVGPLVVGERQNYILFDRMVAYHVQRGVRVPISAGDFYAGLAQRFPARDGMYFLSAQVASYDKFRARFSEIGQLDLFVNDEASAIQWLRQQLEKRPMAFHELQPEFMRETQAWAKHEQTVELRVILEQNFLRFDGTVPVPSQIHSYLSSNFKELRNREKDDQVLVEKAKDRWYVPDPNKQSDLEKLRERSLLREFESYSLSKERRLKQFRTEAVRAGFKAAYDVGDYRTIVAVAAKIPDTVLQEDEKLLMYFDVATMRLGDE